MKKFRIILLFIFTFLILSTVNFSHNSQYAPTLADSGFDGDYDYDSGSDWDSDYGSSSWDDDYDSNYGSSYGGSGGYSGEPADPETVFLALLIIATPVVIVIISKNCARRIKKKKHISDTIYRNCRLQPGEGIENEYIQTAYENYVKIQVAWMNRDLEPVRHLLTDEIYNMYQMQVETLIEDNQINVMSNFKFIAGRINSKTTRNNIETIKITLCVKCKDYIKVANRPTVISGSKHATITYVYQLTFLKDTSKNQTTKCPTCGATVKKQMSTNCEYCKNPLLLTATEMTLSDKSVIYQFKE